MKNYSLISPCIDGLLSDDLLYFEGVTRPSEVYIIRDSGNVTNNEIEILEKYINDIYNLFLRKLSYFIAIDNVNDEDTTKIQALLQELIKVKKMIISASKTKSENLI